MILYCIDLKASQRVEHHASQNHLGAKCLRCGPGTECRVQPACSGPEVCPLRALAADIRQQVVERLGGLTLADVDLLDIEV